MANILQSKRQKICNQNDKQLATDQICCTRHCASSARTLQQRSWTTLEAPESLVRSFLISFIFVPIYFVTLFNKHTAHSHIQKIILHPQKKHWNLSHCEQKRIANIFSSEILLNHDPAGPTFQAGSFYAVEIRHTIESNCVGCFHKNETLQYLPCEYKQLSSDRNLTTAMLAELVFKTRMNSCIYL